MSHATGTTPPIRLYEAEFVELLAGLQSLSPRQRQAYARDVRAISPAAARTVNALLRAVQS